MKNDLTRYESNLKEAEIELMLAKKMYMLTGIVPDTISSVDIKKEVAVVSFYTEKHSELKQIVNAFDPQDYKDNPVTYSGKEPDKNYSEFLIQISNYKHTTKPDLKITFKLVNGMSIWIKTTCFDKYLTCIEGIGRKVSQKNGRFTEEPEWFASCFEITDGLTKVKYMGGNYTYYCSSKADLKQFTDFILKPKNQKKNEQRNK